MRKFTAFRMLYGLSEKSFNNNYIWKHWTHPTIQYCIVLYCMGEAVESGSCRMVPDTKLVPTQPEADPCTYNRRNTRGHVPLFRRHIALRERGIMAFVVSKSFHDSIVNLRAYLFVCLSFHVIFNELLRKVTIQISSKFSFIMYHLVLFIQRHPTHLKVIKVRNLMEI